MKSRIHWIDIAKGLMIIGMVLNHIPNYCLKMGVDISVFPWNFTLGHAYGVFTMQAFFILSGYTTKFEGDTWPFLKKQIKSLMLPYISFTLITSFIAYIIWNEPFTVEQFGEPYFFLVEGYWFLSALFLAKVTLFFMYKLLKSSKSSFVGGFLLLLLSISISEYYSDMPEPTHWNNWFHYRNGLSMTVFITIGYYLRKYEIVEKYGFKIAILYFVLYPITYLFSILELPFSQYLAAPNYTHYLSPNLKDVNGFFLIPSYLFYCVAGSVMVFWFAMKIKTNTFFEYFGENSLIVYCVHFTFLKIVITLLDSIMSTNDIMGAGLYFIIVAILTLLLSAFISTVFQRKPFNYLIGKF